MQAFEELAQQLPPICTPKQIGEMWGRSADHVRDLCSNGLLTHIKTGSRYDIIRDDFIEFLRSNRTCPDRKQAQNSNSGKIKTPTISTITPEAAASSKARAAAILK